jgi:hypothetical protein
MRILIPFLLLLSVTPVLAQNKIYIDQSVGNNTSVIITQSVGDSNYESLIIVGNNNAVTSQQNNNSNLVATIQGINNNISTTQQDGNHVLQLTVPSSNNTISITQTGTPQKIFNLSVNSSNTGVTVVQNSLIASDTASMSIFCAVGACTGYSYIKH